MSQQGVKTTVGAIEDLTQIKAQILNGLTLHLYVNDYTPSAGTNITDVTEATFNDYASLAANDWGAIIEVDIDTITVTLPEKSWTVSSDGGSNEVYGWYLRDTPSNIYAAARDINAPVRMNIAGDQYKTTITLAQLRECNPS